MEQFFDQLSVSHLSKIIDLLHPCMDDYLYVYDFTNDYYYISPHAVERFALPSNEFNNVIATHKKFVYLVLGDGRTANRCKYFCHFCDLL